MSFPVPIKYLLNDNQDATVVVYDDGKEIEGLPDPGCFSQENIMKFADRWVTGALGEKVVINSAPNRTHTLSGNPFNTVLYIPDTAQRYTFDSSLSRIVITPNLNIIPQNMFSNSQLEVLDSSCYAAQNYVFYYTPVKKIILRHNDVVRLNGPNNFDRSPFASGGSGGEVYIPKYLYDHLGDGSALDYKAAAEWSKVDGYGTITWRQIEGSEYEFNYADGTPIGSV